MLETADVALLSAIILILLIMFVRNYVFLRRDSLLVQKYRLYKTRDDLVYLVASGEISEDDFVFQFFYQAVAFLIKHTSILTLKSFVSALQDAGSQGLDPARSDVVERTKQELLSKNPNVQEVVAEFFEAIIETLVENSFLLRCALYFPFFSKRVVAVIIQPGRLQARAYRLYRKYKEAMTNFIPPRSHIADAV